LPSVSAAILRVRKISYFKGAVATKAKFHITIGHETVMGRATFFGRYSDTPETPRPDSDRTKTATLEPFDFSAEYVHQNELLSVVARAGEGKDYYTRLHFLSFRRPFKHFSRSNHN